MREANLSWHNTFCPHSKYGIYTYKIRERMRDRESKMLFEFPLALYANRAFFFFFLNVRKKNLTVTQTNPSITDLDFIIVKTHAFVLMNGTSRAMQRLLHEQMPTFKNVAHGLRS